MERKDVFKLLSNLKTGRGLREERGRRD